MRASISRPALVAAFALLLPAAPALAADSLGVLSVAEPPGPGPELAEITGQFRAIVAERTSGVLESQQVRDRMSGQAPTASLSELDRAFAGALATYQAGDYEGSIRTLRAVIEDLEKLPDGPEAFAQWTRAMLRLARAEQTVGRRAESQALLERLARANPQVKADTTQYPPSFARQVDEAKAAVRNQPTRRLNVQSAQKSVKVFVDGREVGVTPLATSLPAGQYRVSGRLGELRLPSVQVDLSAGDQLVTLDFTIAEALRPSSGPGLALPAADRARRVVTAAAWLGLDRALVLSMAQDGDITYLQGSLYDVRRGMIQREGRLRLSGKMPPPGGLTALASFLLTGQASQLVASAPVTAPTPVAAAPVPLPPPPAGAVVTRTPPPETRSADLAPVVTTRETARTASGSPLLRWSPVVTAAAAVGLGAVAILQNSKANDFKSNSDALLVGNSLRPGVPAASYNKMVTDGNSARSTALVAGAGAGVCLVATGVLGYFSYRQTGEIGPFRF